MNASSTMATDAVRGAIDGGAGAGGPAGPEAPPPDICPHLAGRSLWVFAGCPLSRSGDAVPLPRPVLWRTQAWLGWGVHNTTS